MDSSQHRQVSTKPGQLQRQKGFSDAVSEFAVKEFVGENENLEDVYRFRDFLVFHGLFRDVEAGRVELEERLEIGGRDSLQLDGLFHSSNSKSCEARTG